jgi:very-short-patch-repair endonuclease
VSALASKFIFLWKLAKGPELEAELVFHPTRKWRFDFACKKIKCAIELDGGAFMVHGGRHGRGMGMVKDCEKYRAAADLGWRVWRFTTKCLTAEAVALTAKTFRLALEFRLRALEKATAEMTEQSKFRLLENIEVMACRNSAERVVKAIVRGEIEQAKDLARKHQLAWEMTDREFQDLNQPHRSNDFCDDE